MPAGTLSLTYDAVLSTTLFNYRKTMEDQIATSTAFLFYLMRRASGGYKGVRDLGDRAAMPLMYELGTADSYAGLSLAPVELAA